ncbi:MAG: acyl-CoA dehydrogenase family protein [Halioglobus sp.]|nr:acyl-CoA dehydrogenase family protein [Halioglobus sp.]
MDFSLDEAQIALQEQVTDFCKHHYNLQIAAALDEEPVYPDALHAAMAEAGLLGHCQPSAFGGNDGRIMDAVIINRVLGGYGDAAANIFFVNFIGATLINLAGTEAQKQQILPDVIGGRHRLAFALTEPEAGSDAGGIQCRATPEKNGYVMQGTKLYTTGAMQADTILTVALTHPEEGAKKGGSVFLVPARTAGIAIEPLPKLGGNAVASCRVSYNKVELDSNALLGDTENAAWGSLMVGAGLERVLVAASCLGRAEQILAEVIEFARARRQFGQPIAAFQAIQHQIADMATDIEAMRWLVYRAAWQIDSGQDPVVAVAMAKLFSAEHLNSIVNRGMHLLGGRAYLRECSMQRHLRESLLGLYAGGTAEIQRNLIARKLELH